MIEEQGIGDAPSNDHRVAPVLIVEIGYKTAAVHRDIGGLRVIGGNTIEASAFVRPAAIGDCAVETPLREFGESHIFYAGGLRPDCRSILFGEGFARAFVALGILGEARRKMEGID